MLGRRVISWGALVGVLWPGRAAHAQSDPKGNEPDGSYRLRLPVDEVVLTFHAVDANGLPVHDLKAEEIQLWDNGAAPRRIVAFDELVDRPLRAGILLDTSESMRLDLPGSRAVAEKFVRRLFRQQSDAAFVAEFGFSSELVQSWTGDVESLQRSMESVHERAKIPGGTALFNAIYRACSASFADVDPTANGNFILVFSDGEDNAGLTSMDEAAVACQRSNTQVFAFFPAHAQDGVSTGPKKLRELASKTGGRAFVTEDSEEAIWKDLKAIESEMRNQYRLVYSPADFRHDGAFHEIMLQTPERARSVEVRSGYFAPGQ